MYLKKILGLSGLYFTCYFVLACLYKLILSFPSGDALIIENNLFDWIFNILALGIIYISGYFTFKVFKEADKFIQVFGGIFGALMNGLFYFASNLTLYIMDKKIMDSTFIKDNAISMAVCAFVTFAFYWFCIEINKNLKNKKH